MADAWIDAWIESTEGLRDFREAADFWTLGYRFAVEEYRRGYRPLRPSATPASPRRLAASPEPSRTRRAG